MKAAFPTVFRYGIAGLALVAAYYSAVFARASFLFQQDTASSVPAAVGLVPYDGSYVARLAAWQPEKKRALLERAVRLNPFDYQTWIQLGLIAEMQQHDLASAEHYYLQAATVNHMFLPRWTLANFYFRNEDSDKFFHWAKGTLQISPYQVDPIFAEMWLMSQNASRITAALPDRPGVLLQYVNFLSRTGQFGAIPPVIERLVSETDRREPRGFGTDQILPIEDRILAAAQIRPALTIWQTIIRAGWIHLPVPTPAFPLTNGDFGEAFLEHAFDWVEADTSGFTIEQSAQQKNVEITFSGDEPEHCVLMQQYIPLGPNRSYHLQWQAQGQGLETPTGVAWHLHSVEAGGRVDFVGGDLLAVSHGSWDFRSPPAAEVGLLTLEYSRPLGKLRTNGTFTLQSVFLQEK